MMRFWKRSSVSVDALRPGDQHYRAYIGSPENYDLVAAMVFNLLTCIGLRQQHRLLDIGCGSLRVGRLLIPYLNPGNYVGVEPNHWLLDEGIKHETGKDLIRLKRPSFFYDTSLKKSAEPLEVDYAVAQSIFSHCSKDMIDRWLAEISVHLKDTGALVANFVPGRVDDAATEWVYPGLTRFRRKTLAGLAEKHGFQFELLDWYHPKLSWALFSKPRYDRSFVEGGDISWNNMGKRLKAENDDAR